MRVGSRGPCRLKSGRWSRRPAIRRSPRGQQHLHLHWGGQRLSHVDFRGGLALVPGTPVVFARLHISEGMVCKPLMNTEISPSTVVRARVGNVPSLKRNRDDPAMTASTRASRLRVCRTARPGALARGALPPAVSATRQRAKNGKFHKSGRLSTSARASPNSSPKRMRTSAGVWSLGKRRLASSGACSIP